ncbi:Firmicu-CTERM sorting domain-containing protein [Pediococcus cellicola]|uniref:Firmicu-CTERM sorting domain-containing protein n=1 Tax=Pediococcus cellicola TaxID=319652 RepID=UPI0011BE9A20
MQLECRVAVSALGADDTISQPVSVANSSVNTQEIQAQDSDFITSTDKATDGSNKNTETGSTDDNSALSSSNLDSASSTSSSTSDPVKQAITGSDKTTTDSGLAENNNVNGNLNIKIDGNFDDWKDITKSDMKINGDDDNIKPAALVANDKNVYFYVSMEPKLAGGYNTFQGNGYELNVGGHTYYVTLNDHHDLSLAVGETKLVDVGIYSAENGNKTVTNGCAVTRRNLTQKNGDGSDYAGTSYVWEVAVPFKDLGNISNTADQDITLSDSELWSGKLTSTSGSTGPVVLAGIGFLFALVSVLKFSGIDKKILKNKNSESI